jgi:hypothetical protein
MINKSAIAVAAALVLCTVTGSSSAGDSFPSRALGARAVNALGVVIARQGDAALVQIRRELAESAREAMKPFLPEPEQAAEQPLSAEPPQPTATSTAPHYL